MPAQLEPLLNDIEALKALLRQRDGELQQLRDTVSTLRQALSMRSLEIEQLKLQLAKLGRMQFGRKSEKLDRQIEQLEARLEDLLAEEGEHPVDAAVPEPAAARPRSARQSLPAHLPREDRALEQEEQDCSSCGGKLKPLGRGRVRAARSDRCGTQGDPPYSAQKSLCLLRRSLTACVDQMFQ